MYVIPDITIRRDGTAFSVQVTGELSETLVLNGSYDRMEQRGGMDDEGAEWLHEARRGGCSAGEHRPTAPDAPSVRRVSGRGQYDFFMGGGARMRRSPCKQAADALGVHVSPISRTVQDKYALTPWVCSPLKHFFSSSVACTAEERRHALSSSLAIKDRIKETWWPKRTVPRL